MDMVDRHVMLSCDACGSNITVEVSTDLTVLVCPNCGHIQHLGPELQRYIAEFRAISERFLF